MARMSPPTPPRPDLDALTDAARKLPPMTPAQLREQRISFVYGNCSIDNPRVTKEMVEKVHDEFYGKPNGSPAVVHHPDLAVIHADFQRASAMLETIADNLSKLTPLSPLPSVRIARKWPWQREFWR